MKINNKRLLQNIALLLMVAGLATFIATRVDKNNGRGEVFATLYDKSIGDEATEIIIHAEGNDDIVLQNNNNVWMITKPFEAQADPQKVQQLFTLLAENAETSYPIEGKNLAQYGLDKDVLSISFNGVKMLFGKYNEITQQRYILKGDRMYLITEAISAVMKSGAEAFKRQEQ